MSLVYFLDLTRSYRENFLTMFERLITTSGGMKILEKGSLCAIKLHVGDDGNLNYVNPFYVRRLVDVIRKSGGRPFLTDTTTLYSGRRFRADSHIELAKEHGFDFSPMLIGDGLYGDEYEDVNGSKIARLITTVDTIFCISHFKGHLQTGFGATIKNLGMGCASKGGKLDLHCHSKPYIDMANCTLCLKCFNYCAFKAIKKSNKSLKIDEDICTGCCGCMAVCTDRAIRFYWDAASTDLQMGLARYTANVIKDKKLFCINFLINISPNCDCFHTNEPMIHPDVGILASFDPVAVDAASYDLVKKAIDKLHPEIDPQEQLIYAEKFKAGEKRYEIKTI